MLKKLFIICSILTLFSSNIQAAKTNEKNYDNSGVYVAPQKFNKIYFQLDKLLTCNNQVCIEINNTIVPIHTIFTDNAGSYAFIEVTELPAGPMGTWSCPRCYRSNSVFDSKCIYCKWPDPETGKKK